MDVRLLKAGGSVERVRLAPQPAYEPPASPITSRVAYAAAHVVPRPWAENVPGPPAEIDWDATLAFRRHVWSWGLGVADAMDTAQRNMGLDWAATAELIRRSATEARSAGGDLVVGVNTDHLAESSVSLDEVISAYLHQLEVAEEAGAGVVLMASRHLARAASSASDYERVYREVIARAGSPVVLHWLGTAFDANLAGYWGSDDVPTATDTVVRIMGEHAAKVRGIKMSLLNAESEITVRRRLPDDTTMFTGDDYNYVSLIEGDEVGHSDALLGAFAALAPSASAALQALDRSDSEEYRRILGPTEALARQIFAAPTQYYKTGVAFLSWLNGHQESFTMVGGLHSGRSLVHLSEIVRLANECGALERPELAAARWHGMLGLNGISA
ncbi:dihydrodipicolinate synthase family protein [Lysobacter korlensis]|uniref:Dihydrodipicolinate synthase family protein n=1 Tax=Lysobacter korlensis TaxID=553636 RepID=A0ABV6RP73_9GAMM